MDERHLDYIRLFRRRLNTRQWGAEYGRTHKSQTTRAENDETENSPKVIISTNIFVADPWHQKKKKQK